MKFYLPNKETAIKKASTFSLTAVFTSAFSRNSLIGTDICWFNTLLTIPLNRLSESVSLTIETIIKFNIYVGEFIII